MVDESLIICLGCLSPGHAFGGAGHRHREDDGQVDPANGLPRGHHQQEPIRAAPHSLHHREPGALPVRAGAPEEPQVTLSHSHSLNKDLLVFFSILT